METFLGPEDWAAGGWETPQSPSLQELKAGGPKHQLGRLWGQGKWKQHVPSIE